MTGWTAIVPVGLVLSRSPKQKPLFLLASRAAHRRNANLSSAFDSTPHTFTSSTCATGPQQTTNYFVARYVLWNTASVLFHLRLFRFFHRTRLPFRPRALPDSTAFAPLLCSRPAASRRLLCNAAARLRSLTTPNSRSQLVEVPCRLMPIGYAAY